MKKILALLLLSIVLVASVAPAFAGISFPVSPNEKLRMLSHRQRTEWTLSPDKKSAIEVPCCRCDYEDLYGYCQTYDGPSDKCPYCTNRDKFF